MNFSTNLPPYMPGNLPQAVDEVRDTIHRRMRENGTTEPLPQNVPEPEPGVIGPDPVRETIHRRIRENVTIEPLPQNIPEPEPEVIRPDPVRETARRRVRVRDELEVISDFLARSSLRDDMTEEIRRWADRFRNDINRLEGMSVEDTLNILNEHVGLLQRLLIDPIFQVPLDKKARLGNDGRTYGRKSLTVFLSSIPEEYRHRKPFELEDENSSFTTRPHPVVKYMIKWLERHHALLRSQEVEDLYQELVDQRRRPLLPTEETELLRVRTAERSRRREARREAIRNQLGQDQENTRRQHQQQVPDRFNNILIEAENQQQDRRERLDQEEAENERRARVAEARIDNINARLDNIEEENQQRIQRDFGAIRQGVRDGAQENIRQLGALREQDQVNLRNIEELARQNNERINQIERENERLGASINDVNNQLTEVQKKNAEIRIGINKAKKALEKRNLEFVKGLLIIGGSIAGGWALTLAYQTIIASAAAPIASAAAPAAPSLSASTIQNGAQLNATFIF